MLVTKKKHDKLKKELEIAKKLLKEILSDKGSYKLDTNLINRLIKIK